MRMVGKNIRVTRIEIDRLDEFGGKVFGRPFDQPKGPQCILPFSNPWFYLGGLGRGTFQNTIAVIRQQKGPKRYELVHEECVNRGRNLHGIWWHRQGCHPWKQQSFQKSHWTTIQWTFVALLFYSLLCSRALCCVGVVFFRPADVVLLGVWEVGIYPQPYPPYPVRYFMYVLLQKNIYSKSGQVAFIGCDTFIN